MKKNIFKKALSLLLCITLITSYIPIIFVSTTMALSNADRRVDPSTMDVWKEFFGEQITSTKNAGRVWTDKSVFTDTSAFPNNTVSMLDSANNFLVALSAISANKEIVGYSTIPTDTMLVLDVSGSMDDNASTLVAATNDAIKTLLGTNKNNRVGVVLYSASGSTGTSSYSQSTTVILPLDRYTTGNDGRYLTLSGNTVSVSRNLRNSDNQNVSASKGVTGGTYIQSGLYAAMLEFQKADTVVESNNFQGGQDRLPILVLMSDGAPTTGNTNFTSVNSSNSNIGNGGSRSATDAMGFITQLTASYVLNRIEAHYNCADRGLFYTLGLDVGSESDTNVAVSVLDPANSTSTINSYWRRYLALDSRTALQITAPGTRNSENPGTKTVSIYKNAYAVNQFYTDKYFPASNAEGLTNAFKDIVDEIILQSRYYPTNLEGGHPDFSGYLRFEDRIGDYMDVKDIKGILIGDTLFDGHMMASNFTSTGTLGSIEDPTELGLEFVNSVKTRLGITDDTTVFTLVTEANRTKQLYSDANGWSNYIGWYAAADGSFLGHYNEGTTTAPADAVYKVKSYGFLGKSDGNIKDSDMMYMSVQLRINIESGEETLAWSIPAALVPIVTYKVTLEGTNIASATNVSVTREEADPIRLIYEVGLDSRYNELNIHTVTDPKHVADDGSRIFWTNYWDNSAAEHTDHFATESKFTPSEQNELYYYISDSLIYEKDGSGNYVPVSTNGALDKSKTYYHSYYVFSTTSSTPIVSYLQIHENTLAKAEWRADYEVSATDTGAYVIPIGTPYQFIEEELYIAKESNVTESIIFSGFPYVNITNASSTAGVKLGNNGLLTVKPASGIKLSKTIDTVEPGASDLFTFRITLTDASGKALEGTYTTLLADLDKTEGESGSITFTNGVADINLRAGKTVYITGLPVGAVYTVEEISVNTAYKIKDVHLNGQSLSAKLAAGTVKEMSLEDVKFINTPTSDGNLVITKRVTHPFGTDYAVPASITFKAKVTLTYGGAPLAGETFDLARSSGITSVTTDENGEFTVTLTNGESVSVHNIPEETEYTVTEIELPDGFTLDRSASSALNGYISAEGNANAVLVNSYTPDPVSPESNEIVVSITKDFSGRDWTEGDVFEFTLEELHPVTRDVTTVIAKVIITSASELTKLFDLKYELYTSAGIYHYRITEKVTSATNGITYDTVERRFQVTVTDSDMDGKLEISGVENVMNTVITKDGDNYKVSASFKNVYAPYLGTSVEFNVQKYISGHTFPLNGFRFGLYNESGEDLIMESTVTGANGIASFKLAYTASDVGTYTYVLKEIAGSINGMTYDTTEYVVTVVVTDNGDGTTSASYTVTKDGNAVSGNPTFTNTYEPTEATLLVSGNKVLTGRVQNENEFEFELYEITSSGEVLLQTVKNSYVGDFVFDLLTFDTAGTYRYEVREKNTGLGGVTYDTKTYSFTVTVVDENGVLVASSDLSGEIIFNNSYAPKGTTVTLVGNKILSGRDIRDGEFSFTIIGPDGYSETVNNVGGRLSFSSLTFNKAGTYVYTVKEDAGSVSGITYDKSVYTVTVTVTDDGVGALHATVSYKDNGAEASGIVFRNGYSPASIDITISGTKDLIGRDVLNGEFEFVLSNAVNGAQIESVTNVGTDFDFSPYTVHTAGTYTFTVKEVDTGKGGVTYDTAIYTVAVTVVDDLNGKLIESGRVITRNGQSASDVEFVNVYNASPVTVALTGTKTLNGRDMKDGEFSFTITGPSGYSETVANVGSSFTFKALSFDAEGTYVYTVTEDEGTLGGITYDSTVYTVTINVSDNGRGKLVATTTYTADGSNASGISFTNTYATSDATINLSGTKDLIGRDIRDGEFFFTITGPEGYSETVKNVGRAFTFKTISFNEAGTYVYTVVENAGSLGGVTYDNTVYVVTVKVTDNGNGELVAGATYARGNDTVSGISFTNSYSPASVTVDLSGSKELSGRDIRDGEFFFTIKGDNLSETVKNVGKTFEFSTITLNKVGTYVYTVTENAGSLGGVTYDKAVYTVTVNVTDDGNGKLVASVSYAKDGNTVNGISFTNSYKPASTSIMIMGSKELSGRDIRDGEFSFTLTGNGITKTVKNAGKVFSFGDLTFEKAGTYVYKVTEDAGNLGGVTYDNTVYTVTIVVTDNEDGKLVASAYFAKGNDSVSDIIFTNSYKPTSVTVDLSGNKELSGRDMKDGEFYFTITGPDSYSETVKNVGKTFTFKTLTFDKAGTYVYTVTENAGSLGGVTYDTTAYTVTIVVTDDGNGKLSARVTYTKGSDSVTGISFKNTYSSTSVTVTVTGNKELSGRDMKDGEFYFTITGPEGYSETVKNAGKTFTFKTLNFNKAGTYVYTVTEDAGTLGGVTYDKAVYTVTVNVTDDGNGKLVASVSYAKDGKNANEISFQNSYKASSTEVTVVGGKELSGRDMKDGEFFFTIKGDNLSETVKNVGKTFTFGKLTFDKAGTYVYTVTEDAGTLGGVTYDKAVYTVTVNVTDNGEGKLVASVSYAKDGITASEISFVNSYKAASTEITVSGGKELSGRDMKDGEFSFTIKGDNYTETVKNAGKTFTFAPLTFDKAGTYVYTVTENAGTLGGITYDTTAYTVTVVVTDDGEGKLLASVAYTKGNDKVDSISFKNTYSSTSVTVTVSGSKDLSGRDIKDGEFSFTIKGDNYSDTKKNVGNVFTFDTLTFDKTGTYVYTVTEDAGALGGVKYDTTAYTVTVVVTDNGEGKLIASVSYAKGSDTVSAISFVNTYSSTSATVTVSGNKELDGRDMKDGEFSFTLNGNGTSDTKKNGGKTFTFDTLTFDKAGTYVYTVTEDEGTLGGITYDKTVYTVTVVVTDNGEGKLVASVSYAKGNDTATGITFNNGYKSNAVNVTFTGIKNLTGRDIKADEFTFMLFNANDKFTVNGEAFDLVKNLADGSFSFKALEFDKVGTWYYVVKEDTSAEEKGMTYDTTVYGIKVTVTDNGEGQLVASVEISTDEGAVNGITFNNVYEEPFVPSPDTGDETAIGLFLMMLTVTSIGFIAIKSKKRRIAE